MINSFLTSQILEKTNSSEILEVHFIQALWNDFGELNRVILNNDQVILKLIKFPTQNSSTPHPHGWNSDLGFERKRRSYQIESLWYQHYDTKIEGAYYPKYLASGHYEDYQYLLLEDLKALNFSAKDFIPWEKVQLCLSWLANFHKYYLHREPKHLWPIGTYWHLDTRPEEFEAMSDQELKMAAASIDQRLNQAKHKTIVHGDAKLANFLFKEKLAAAVDFQYVGGGVGVKDVAYFLSSIYQEEELFKNEKRCLDFYFQALNLTEVEQEWRELYPFAWCDFYRFLQGWSPSHWKINGYLEEMKKKVLKCL